MKKNMNNKYIKITISLTCLLVANLPSAYAQQRGGARFNFAPNYYRIEQASVPDGYAQPGPAHAVKSGHVPSSKDILGLDPGSLPVAPVAPPTIRQPQLTQATPVHYQESFGSPNNVPALAALPKALTPMTPRAKVLASDKQVSAKLMHSKNNRYIATKATGKLLKKHGQSGQALSLKPASYGNGFGYQPGGYMPSAVGDGTNANTSVYGKLLHRN